MKKNKASDQRKQRTFRIYAPKAITAYLLGDFNNWNGTKHFMGKKIDGSWEISLNLFPGTYEYKFKVDKQWLNDPDNPYTCPNVRGKKNSIITVE